MLSDEEEILIKKLSYCEQEYEQNGYLSVGKFKAIKQAIELIEKQQKEIESMAEFIWKYDCCEHFKKEDENFKCEGWYINRECRENCIKPHFRKEII